jgi:hypothetical protein
VRDRKRRYLAYLLRLWQVQDEGGIGWRASVENAHTGEKVGFAHLDELVAFLRERTGLAPPAESLMRAECPPKAGSEPKECGRVHARRGENH